MVDANRSVLIGEAELARMRSALTEMDALLNAVSTVMDERGQTGIEVDGLQSAIRSLESLKKFCDGVVAAARENEDT